MWSGGESPAGSAQARMPHTKVHIPSPKYASPAQARLLSTLPVYGMYVEQYVPSSPAPLKKGAWMRRIKLSNAGGGWSHLIVVPVKQDLNSMSRRIGTK